MTVKMEFREGSDVLDFLRELAPLFGSPRAALEAYVRSSALFHVWRARVALCPECNRHIPVDGVQLGEHRIPNPAGTVPYWVPCPGSRGPAQPWTANPAELLIARAHIEHHINTVQPGLLGA